MSLEKLILTHPERVRNFVLSSPELREHLKVLAAQKANEIKRYSTQVSRTMVPEDYEIEDRYLEVGLTGGRIEVMAKASLKGGYSWASSYEPEIVLDHQTFSEKFSEALLTEFQTS